jgi:putative cardiolipin synthase
MKFKIKDILRKLFYGVVALMVVAYLILSAGLALMYYLAQESKEGPTAVEASSHEPHTVQLIDGGRNSLSERLKLIESAQKSIELEFFIFDIDRSSRLVTEALIKQADKGVQVRILVDFSAPVFQLKPAYASILKQHGIEVRYYNTTAIYRVVSSQHRSHRKLLIVDGVKLITGGRNIANDYFDLGEHYNFLDSDLLIQGPIVTAALNSFELYWSSDLSEKSSDPKKGVEEATKKLTVTSDDREVLSQKTFEPPTPAVQCRDIAFVTDIPGRSTSARRVFPAIVKVLNEAKSHVLAESPYLVLRQGGLEVMQDLKSRGIKMTVLTNGLYSTDASYVVSSLVLQIPKLAKTGLTLYTYNGDPTPGMTTRMGIHAKRAVIDDKIVILGTYNIDPRSANLNSELIVICYDSPELAGQVTASIQARMAHSDLIIKEGATLSLKSVFHNSSFGQIASFALLMPIAHLFDFIL